MIDIEATIVETIYQEMIMSSQAAGMPDDFIDLSLIHI